MLHMVNNNTYMCKYMYFQSLKISVFDLLKCFKIRNVNQFFNIPAIQFVYEDVKVAGINYSATAQWISSLTLQLISVLTSAYSVVNLPLRVSLKNFKSKSQFDNTLELLSDNTWLFHYVNDVTFFLLRCMYRGILYFE